MAICLHGSAHTMPRVRAQLQLAIGSHRSLAKLYGINPKTVAKWRARTSVLDEPMGPRGRASQYLSQEQEHLAILLRKQGHLSLDDLMGQLLELAPKLSLDAIIQGGGQHERGGKLFDKAHSLSDTAVPFSKGPGSPGSARRSKTRRGSGNNAVLA